jgi:hypothetical protein
VLKKFMHGNKKHRVSPMFFLNSKYADDIGNMFVPVFFFFNMIYRN